MTVAPMPMDMVVMAQDMDRFGIEAHVRRVSEIVQALEDRKGARIAVTGLDLSYPKPRHTTAFGDPSVIVESCQTRNIQDVPVRSIRIYGSEHLCNAHYEEVDTRDPDDVLAHSDLDDAIAFATRIRDMLAHAHPSRDRSVHPGYAPILRGLAAYFTDSGMRPPEREFSLWTGRPYGLPQLKIRDGRGDFHASTEVDPARMDAWLPPAACFSAGHRTTFGLANVRMDGSVVDWSIDPMEILRMAARKDERCSG